MKPHRRCRTGSTANAGTGHHDACGASTADYEEPIHRDSAHSEPIHWEPVETRRPCPWPARTMRRSGPVGAAKLMQSESRSPLPDGAQRPWGLDRQGWSTLLAGALLLLISFTTNYGDVNLLGFGSLQTAQQIGVGLHLAALAALAGDVELASRLRHRASDEAARAERAREREANEAARERDRAAAARKQTTRRAQLEDGCLVAQCRFLLADTARNRLQLSEALAVLIEGRRSPQG